MVNGNSSVTVCNKQLVLSELFVCWVTQDINELLILFISWNILLSFYYGFYLEGNRSYAVKRAYVVKCLLEYCKAFLFER